MITAEQFIEARGGTTTVANSTGYKPGAVALWKHRNKLPRTAWPEIVRAYPDVSIEDLLKVEAASERARKRKAA